MFMGADAAPLLLDRITRARDSMVRAGAAEGLAERGYLAVRVGGPSGGDDGVYSTSPCPLWGLGRAVDPRVSGLPALVATNAYAITISDGALSAASPGAERLKRGKALSTVTSGSAPRAAASSFR